MIDPASDRPKHRQLADALRAQITGGALAPGARLPTEADLAHLNGVNRSTVRRSLEILRAEGLIDVRHPAGTFVRERPIETIVDLTTGTIRARMPSPAERRAMDIPEGVPLLVVDGEIYPADRTALRIASADLDGR